MNELHQQGNDAKSIPAKIVSHNEMLSNLLSELRPIKYTEIADLADGQSMRKKHFAIITIDEILRVAKAKNWSLCFTNGTLYVFNGACWSPLSKSELLQFLGKAAENLGMDVYDAKYYATREELLKQFNSTAYLPAPLGKKDEVLINLKNGTFSITPIIQKLREFDKNDFMRYQLPFEYIPGADAPQFKKYLDRVLPEKQLQEILSEFIACVFIKNNSLKLEKSLILYGSGANGKSVFFEVTSALLGSENISNYSLQSLTNESGYHRAKLANKLLNYASEISPRMDSTTFKLLVSGEPVDARLPYGEPFILTDYAKMAFNTNELPKDVEQNEAFFRRFLIIPFEVMIPENERDPELAKRIIRDELPGIFNWVLEGLQRLLQQQKFTQSDIVDKTVAQYRQQSDSVQLFLIEEDYVKDDIQELPLKQLYNMYKDFCIESSYRACSNRIFAERLRNVGFNIFRKQLGNVIGIKKNRSI